MRLPPPRRSGFSVLEVVVAAVVAAILATLLAGAALRVRKQNRKMLDIANLRQIGSGFHLYLLEHQQKFPPCMLPVPKKTLAQYLGYIPTTKDWSNDSASPKNSIFSPAANREAIHALFTSGYDDRPKPDPLNSFSTNQYLGLNPSEVPGEESVQAHDYREVRRPELKIWVVPSLFVPNNYHGRLSGAKSHSPFRSDRNAALHGSFPALFLDGHVAFVDPAPKGMSDSEILRRWLLPKREP